MYLRKLNSKHNIIIGSLLLCALAGFSQHRSVDLEVVCDSPADTLVNGIGEPLRFCTFNNGPDLLYNKDTILYALYVIENGDAHQVYSGATIGTSTDTIPIGGSRCYVDNYNITFPYPDREDTFTVEFCVAVGSSYINEQGDTIHPFSYIDPDTENNLCCKSVTVIPRSSTAITAPGEAEGKVFLYPNPVRDVIYIRSPDQWNAEPLFVTLRDINGHVVAEQQYEKGHDDRMLDVSGLPPGIYLMRLQSADAVVTRKVVVER